MCGDLIFGLPMQFLKLASMRKSPRLKIFWEESVVTCSIQEIVCYIFWYFRASEELVVLERWCTTQLVPCKVVYKTA